ncbi:alpha/beta hydrolase [Bacillus haikouensis]|nr:alpha/beta hydrolase [Bacillus haikouensis]
MNTFTNHYYVQKTGQGKSVIFLPAGGFSGNEGLNIAEYLNCGYETHMIDLPGFGRSKGIEGRTTTLKMAKWVKGYLDQEEIEKAILIGHSMGGALLLNFAVHYPERVNRLILLDQGHKRFPRVPVSEFGVFAYAFPFLNVCVRLFGFPLLKRLEPLFSKEDDSEIKDVAGEAERFCQRFSIPDSPYVRMALKQQPDFSIDALNLMFGYYNLNLPVLLEQIEVPVYLVYGTFKGMDEKEFKFTERAIRKMKRKTDSVTYRSLNGGHYVHWNKSFNLDELKEFLESSH